MPWLPKPWGKGPNEGPNEGRYGMRRGSWGEVEKAPQAG